MEVMEIVRYGEGWKKELIKHKKENLEKMFGVSGNGISKNQQIEAIRVKLMEENSNQQPNQYPMKIIISLNELVEFLKPSLGKKIQILTPQFERDFELEIDFIPQDKGELESLIATAPKDVLQKMGCCVWCTYESEQEDRFSDNYLKPGEIHYLFPHEWYDIIPNGFEIVNIFGKKRRFKHGVTDDDKRFGCLCFGFVRNF